MSPEDLHRLKGYHGQLVECWKVALAARDLCGRISSDTAFAFGEMAGTISKAKALLGRDIDDTERRPPPSP